MIELRHLKTLAALRDTGSLVEAADRIHLTQSALSHQIKDLEDRFNCSLFVRKTKPISFTAAGRRMLALADNILPMVKNTEREIARLACGETGRLNVSIDCHSCFEWLMPTIDSFRKNWPEIEMDLANGFTFAPIPALAKGDIDLVITSDPIPRNGISYTPLFSYESLIAMSNNHSLINKKHIDATDFIDETLITYPVNQDRLDIFTRFLDPAGIQPKEIRTTDLTLMMIQLVASGRGVAALPNWALDQYLQKNYISAKPIGDKGQWCTLYAAIREEQLNAEFMTDFLETAREVSFANLAGIKSA
ncbi:LysR family transcriptional regulator [Gammaproteobacteria bacterium AS21]|mgnify:CR=1 FL=1|jgi:LysR family transcriptional regulator for metE and metH